MDTQETTGAPRYLHTCLEPPQVKKFAGKKMVCAHSLTKESAERAVRPSGLLGDHHFRDAQRNKLLMLCEKTISIVFWTRATIEACTTFFVSEFLPFGSSIPFLT